MGKTRGLYRLVGEVWYCVERKQIRRAVILIEGFGLREDINMKRLLKVLAEEKFNFRDIGPLFKGREAMKEDFVRKIKDQKRQFDFIEIHNLPIENFP